MRKTKYNLYDYDVVEDTQSFKRCKFYMVKREYKSNSYFDIAIECDGFVFVLQPKSFYSGKTHFVFQKMLHAIAKDKYANQEEPAPSFNG